MGGSSFCAKLHSLHLCFLTPRRDGCRDYLRQLNLYRTRAWTCGATGQGGLTYEEALTSEAQQDALVQVRTDFMFMPVTIGIPLSH